MKRRFATVASVGTLATVMLLGSAAAARADHHFNFIREVFPGVTADPSAEFVELQMYAAGQTVLTGQGQNLTYYGASGSINHLDGFGTNLANGESQRTALMGESSTDTLFGVTRDFTIGGFNVMNPAGGAVCFRSTPHGYIDCVSWGTFDNTTAGLPVGTNETGPIPSGSSIVRSIAAGSPSLLDAADDTNDSQADFSATDTPSPCPNSALQTPTVCDFSVPAAPAPPGGTPLPPKKKCKKAKKKRSATTARKRCKKKRK